MAHILAAGGLALILLDCGVFPAGAQKAPAGMVPYEHPVYRHGKRVLWHGISHGERDSEATSAVAKAPEPKPTAANTAAASVEYTICADGDDTRAMRVANDVATAVKAADLRARAVGGRVSPPALAKLASGESVDFVIAPLDALVDDAKSSWKDKAPYVARLGDETIEIVADRSIAAVGDLNGRSVAVGPTDSAGAAVATALFGRLGVKPRFINEELPDALDDLVSRRADAVVAVGAEGSKNLGEFGRSGKFHLVALPMTPALSERYAPVRLTTAERPRLVAAGAKIDTVAAPTALIAVNAAPESQRATRDGAFVKALFDRIPTLLGPNSDPTWRDVNLAATFDWPRLGSAEAWVGAHQAAADPAFESFREQARSAAAAAGGATASDADTLFQSLLKARGPTP